MSWAEGTASYGRALQLRRGWQELWTGWQGPDHGFVGDGKSLDLTTNRR